MKKHPQAELLANRLAEAANKPVAVIPFTLPENSEPESSPEKEFESEAIHIETTSREEPRRRRRVRSRAQPSEEPEDDTVPISLRPRRELLMRYVLAASERTREAGRVISAQQIMLERLEGGP
jgi:hypothetical protein